MSIEDQLHWNIILACPACKGDFAWDAAGAECERCRARYPLVDGVPIFADLDGSDPGADYKRRQLEFFDAEQSEFETMRPHATPRLYGWLMAEKFRRSIRGVEDVLDGSTLLTVCGGSGMEAEFLARAGARVVSSDLSLAAAKRARERARRLGLQIVPIVADAERLPVADRGVDAVYVHDGLHHLADPLVGLIEMARAADRFVCVTEPARAAVTDVAVRAGIALAVEEAGNRVERLDERDVERTLETAGFRIAGSHRYAMYYRHHPGPILSVLSRAPFYSLARATLMTFNRLFGRFGNKLAVQAIRDQRTAAAARS